MILVVLGHCYSFSQDNLILYWIYGFRMPFFFVVSGILYSQKIGSNSISFNFHKKSKTMLIPYFAFEIPFACYLCLAQYLAGGLDIIFCYRKFLSVLNCTGLQTTWFLPCLLLVQIIFYIFMKAGKSACTVAMIGLMLVGLLASNPSGYLIVLLRCFVACGFFAIGFIGGSAWWMQMRHPVIVLAAAATYGVLSVKNGLVSLVSCIFGNAALYVLNSLLGTFVLIQISISLYRVFGQLRITSGFAYIGRNSIIVLCTQSFVIEFIRLADYKLLHSFLPRLGYGEGFVFCIIVMLIEIPIMMIGQSYCPALFGMKLRRIKNEN